MESYDAAALIMLAMQAAGSTDPAGLQGQDPRSRQRPG
jgi:hypothetical protein